MKYDTKEKIETRIKERLTVSPVPFYFFLNRDTFTHAHLLGVPRSEILEALELIFKEKRFKVKKELIFIHEELDIFCPLSDEDLPDYLSFNIFHDPENPLIIVQEASTFVHEAYIFSP